MNTKKNDFDQESYVEKIDSAHSKLKSLEVRIKKVEDVTDSSLLLKTFKKDSDLRDEFEKLIWQTIQRKCLTGFLWILGAVIVIPVFSKIFTLAMAKFGITF